ncbi:MAG TPA: HAD family hydrolase [Vicinamibacterales bacterium]|nr:HAD family hydrolase [Vicinamibacterales bacterium]
MRPAIVLDRDGTLIEEAGYLDRLERLVFYPWSIDAVRVLARAGFAIVVVTNQAGVARGIVREAFVAEAHDHIRAKIEAAGAHVDGFYYCPHHPEAKIDRYRLACDCRKPQPGLIRRAARDLDLDLARSWAIGDRWHDLQAGAAVGARGILVRTGYGRTEEATPPGGFTPEAVVDDVMAAASLILRSSAREA